MNIKTELKANHIDSDFKLENRKVILISKQACLLFIYKVLDWLPFDECTQYTCKEFVNSSPLQYLIKSH